MRYEVSIINWLVLEIIENWHQILCDAEFVASDFVLNPADRYISHAEFVPMPAQDICQWSQRMAAVEDFEFTFVAHLHVFVWCNLWKEFDRGVTCGRSVCPDCAEPSWKHGLFRLSEPNWNADACSLFLRSVALYPKADSVNALDPDQTFIYYTFSFHPFISSCIIWHP